MKNKFRIAHRIARNVLNTEAGQTQINDYITTQLRKNNISEAMFQTAWSIVSGS